jgi:hypothetical protein
VFHLYLIDCANKRLTIFQPAIEGELASEVLKSWSDDTGAVCGLWPAATAVPSWLLSSSLLVSFRELELPSTSDR